MSDPTGAGQRKLIRRLGSKGVEQVQSARLPNEAQRPASPSALPNETDMPKAGKYESRSRPPRPTLEEIERMEPQKPGRSHNNRPLYDRRSRIHSR